MIQCAESIGQRRLLHVPVDGGRVVAHVAEVVHEDHRQQLVDGDEEVVRGGELVQVLALDGDGLGGG